MTYTELIDKKISSIYQAGIATKILQHMDRIRNVSDTSQARRWVMELLQNSRDVAYEDQPVKIRIVLEDKCLSFFHNGKPFRVKDILSVINQVSSKNPDESTIGQFGTGFMTTYQLSEVVEINSVLKDNDLPYKPFSIRIDRRGSEKEEILDGIFKTMEELKKADDGNELINYDKNAYNTQFKYHLENIENYEIAKTGLDDLKSTILYVLLFSEKIEQVELIYDTAERKDSILYLRGTDTVVTEKLHQLELIEKSTKNGTTGEKNHYLIYLCQDGMTLAAETDEKKEFVGFSEYTPKLFVDFPLIGAEKFPFPVVINHRGFKTNEPRSGITLVDNASSKDALINKELMKQAVLLYKDFLHECVEYSYSGLEAVVKIPEWSPNKEWSENWVKAHIYRKLYRIISQEKMIETVKGKKELSSQDMFLIRGENAEKDGVKELVQGFRMHMVPIGSERWYEALQGYGIEEDKILSLPKIAAQAEWYLKNCLDETSIPAITWCQTLYRLCKANPELQVELKAGNICIFPNQDETDWKRRKLYNVMEIKKDPEIPEILKNVSDRLDALCGSNGEEGLYIRKFLLHKEFKADVPELEIYELTKLTNHIIYRSNRSFPVKNFNLYQYEYENAWQNAWHYMISCGPDEKLYHLSKKILKEKLPDWQPLDERFGKGLWKNTYSCVLGEFLTEISCHKTLEQLQKSKLPQDTKEEVYEWLNGIYEKVCQYKTESDLRFQNVVPNQEGALCKLCDLYLDCSKNEELKEIAKEFSGRNEACNVYKTLIDKKICFQDNVYLSMMNDAMIAGKIHTTVLELLSETGLPDAELVYQEACTKLLGWIQEHLEDAKSYFPDFWKEEDQMRLLTPKAAVKVQKKARELEQVLKMLDVESIEEAKEKVNQLKENADLMENNTDLSEEDLKPKKNTLLFDWDWDVYYDEELQFLSGRERQNVLREIGIDGERFAFQQLKEYFLQQNYCITEESSQKIKLQLENGKASVELDYPDNTVYHQPGWDISIRVITAEKEELYYIEVKTHTKQSSMRNILCLSNEQMKMAAKQQEYYVIAKVIYDFRKQQGAGINYYQNPIKQIADGILCNLSGKYELKLYSGCN